MRKSVCFLSKKGGVGKTTFALNCAHSLSLSHQRTLLIDMDGQANLTKHLLDTQEPLSRSQGLFQVLSGRCSADEALRQTHYEYLDILPGHPDLEDLPMFDARVLREPTRLKQILSPLLDAYDYLLVDCPPAINWLTRMVLFATDAVVVPVQAEPYALQGLQELIPMLDRMTATAQLHRIVINMYRGQTQLHQSLAEEIAKRYPGRTATNRVRQTIQFAEAAKEGLSIFEYAPGSPGAIDMYTLCWELFELDADQVQSAMAASTLETEKPGIDEGP